MRWCGWEKIKNQNLPDLEGLAGFTSAYEDKLQAIFTLLALRLL